MDDKTTDTTLPRFPESYWLEQSIPSFAPLEENSKTEVGVIGAGITGIMTAYLLAKAGKKVTLIDAKEILSGVTGHTTAKITAQHSIFYKQLMSTFGKEQARLYYEANIEGLDLIQDTVEELNIDCNFETKDAVIYATTDKGVKQVEKEARAYAELGIQGVLMKGRVPELPFDTKAALVMKYQAQFHPVKFLVPLLKEIERLGGKIYEQTRAVKLSKGETTVHMENGSELECDKVVVATHYPFNDFNGLYFSKLKIERSYVITAKVNRSLPNGMYINVESPSQSLRTAKNDQGEDLLLIGGSGHQTGKSKQDTREHYQHLEEFGKKWFDLEKVSHHWSAQDLTTLDKVPYIGQMTRSSSNVLVATGFHKWGMALGAVGARLLADLILEEPNVYEDLFNPLREKSSLQDMGTFTQKNASVGKDLVITKSKRPIMEPEDLKPDQGALVSVGGKKAGGYRDENGQLYLVKTTCTHMGCGTVWNDAERSWDCPCHGSRFSHTGEVLDGPAVKPLERIDSEE